MKAVIINCLENMISERYGRAKWETTLEAAGLAANTRYLPSQDLDDRVAMKIFAATCATSLSPRPERFTIKTWPFAEGARRTASVTAWLDSSAGMIPSMRQSRRAASSAAPSPAAQYSARPWSCSQACSGPIIA